MGCQPGRVPKKQVLVASGALPDVVVNRSERFFELLTRIEIHIVRPLVELDQARALPPALTPVGILLGDLTAESGR